MLGINFAKMARLLRDLDYLRVIQADNLSQIIEGNQQIKLDIEQSAQSEMISYLAQRYKVNEVFSNTAVFDFEATYNGKQLVEYTETAFSVTSNYEAGDRVVYSGYIYSANDAVTASAWDVTEWTLICADKQLFYVTLPESEFDYYTTYAVGNKVWFENKVYPCLEPCVNIDPTDTKFWGKGTSFSVTATYPDDSGVWTIGDNRNQQIVLFLIDIVLYHLHSRINPRNIPDLRKQRYNGDSSEDKGGALGWLKSVAKGNVQADLPAVAPKQGLSMRSGNAGTYSQPSNNMLW